MKINNRYILGPVLAVLISSVLPSCQFDDVEPTKSALQMTFNAHEAEVMVGDTVTLSTIFTPDDVTAPKAFWYKYAPQVALDVNDRNECRVIGTQACEAWVYAVTLNEQLRDSCLVHVTDRWSRPVPSAYEYDMVIYADVRIDGTHNAPQYQVAAFVGDQLRGLGEIVDEWGVKCTVIRIWHHVPDRGEIKFRYYDSKAMKVYDLDYSITFDGQVHGSLTNPVIITN